MGAPRGGFFEVANLVLGQLSFGASGDFLIEVINFQVKFFGFSLDLIFDKVAEDFGVDGGFDVDGHCCILGGSTVQDDFQLFCHSAFTGKSLDSGKLTSPTFNAEFFRSMV